MPKPVLIFHYEKSVTLTTKSKEFKEAIKFILDRQEPTTFTPYKVVIEATGKTLHFDEREFKSFAAGTTPLPYLIGETECDGLFRNKNEISVNENDTIDPGSLWKLKFKQYILVDDDRYLAINAPNDNFVEI